MDLADIVKDPGQGETIEVVFAQAEATAQVHREVGDPVNVPVQILDDVFHHTNEEVVRKLSHWGNHQQSFVNPAPPVDKSLVSFGKMGPMDAASGLVEVFLRVNGYLTLTEWQIQVMNARGQWETITDVDVVGVRFPGDIFLAESQDPDIKETLKVSADLLNLDRGVIDVIVGEIKEGEAVFNPALTRYETLYTVLHRISWLYANDGLEKVVSDLGAHGISYQTAPGGDSIRTRLVAFGQSPAADVNTIPIDLILEQSTQFLAAHDALFRSVRFVNPVAATLKLLHKTGFELTREKPVSPDS